MKKKRETKGKNISFYCPDYLISALEEVVENEGSSKSEIIQRLVRDYCRERTKNPQVREKLNKEKAKEKIDSMQGKEFNSFMHTLSSFSSDDESE